MQKEAITLITVQEVEYVARPEIQNPNAVRQTILYAYLKDVVQKDIQRCAVGIAARRTASAATVKIAARVKKLVAGKTKAVRKRLLVVNTVSPKNAATRTFRRVVMAMDVLIRASLSSTLSDVSWLVVHFPPIASMMNADLGANSNFGEYCDLTKIPKSDLLLKIPKPLKKLYHTLTVEVGKGTNRSLYQQQGCTKLHSVIRQKERKKA